MHSKAGMFCTGVRGALQEGADVAFHHKAACYMCLFGCKALQDVVLLHRSGRAV